MRAVLSPSGAARNAARAALVAAVLAVPFIGVRLDDVDGRNGLAFHPIGVAAAAAIVFAVRLALDVLAARRSFAWTIAWRPAHRHVVVVVGAVLVAALVIPFTPLATRYGLDLATTFFIYVMLGLGLNIVVGLAGLLDLGYVAFYAAGAYTAGLLAMHFKFGFWLALPFSGLTAAVLGLVLGFPVLRLKGDYLAIVTLGFGEIIRIVLINWGSVTGGPNGINGLPRPSFFGLPFAARAPDGGMTFAKLVGVPFSPVHRIGWLYFVTLAFMLLTFVFTARLRRLPIGRAWEALREDEIACQALGLNPTVVKLTAFSLGAMLGGFAGCFFAARQGFISPESFVFNESAKILAIVVLGGMGSQLGVVIAAAVLVILPELGRTFAEYRMVLFGLAMVAIMVWRPGGLVSARSPSIRADLSKIKDPEPVATR